MEAAFFPNPESFALDFFAGGKRTKLQLQILWEQKYAGKPIRFQGKVSQCEKHSTSISLSVIAATSIKEVKVTMGLPLSLLEMTLALNRGDLVHVEGTIRRHYSDGLALLFLDEAQIEKV